MIEAALGDADPIGHIVERRLGVSQVGKHRERGLEDRPASLLRRHSLALATVVGPGVPGLIELRIHLSPLAMSLPTYRPEYSSLPDFWPLPLDIPTGRYIVSYLPVGQ